MAPVYQWPGNLASTTSDDLLFSKGITSVIDGIVYDTISQTGKTPYKVFNLFRYGVPSDSSGYLYTCQPEPKNFNDINDLNICLAQQ